MGAAIMELITTAYLWTMVTFWTSFLVVGFRDEARPSALVVGFRFACAAWPLVCLAVRP